MAASVGSSDIVCPHVPSVRMVTVIQIGRGHTGCNYLSIAPGDELHPLMVEGALFLGYIPLPGLAVVRRRDGGASVFNLASAVQTGAPHFVLADRPLDLGEAMDYPWHAASRVCDFGGRSGDIVVISFHRYGSQTARAVQLNNPLHLPRIRALLERGGRCIAQNAREERWRRRAEAVCMGLHPRLGGQGSGIGLLDPAILLCILGDSFPNPVDRGRVLPGRFLKIYR